METININNDSELVLDTQSKDIQININKCRVIVTDISACKKNIIVNDGYLDYCFVKRDNSDTSTNVSVYNGEAKMNIIDIANNDSSNEYTLTLENENSNVDISIASVSKNNSQKKYKVNSKNMIGYTSSKIDCFGIVEDTSLLKYDITSFIKNGAKKSIVNQNSKILLFDKQSIGINNPILEIEENDVKANHGSSIGMIDEETLFYLTSRGIKDEDARKLVSFGKINYIIDAIKDEKIKNELLKEMMEV